VGIVLLAPFHVAAFTLKYKPDRHVLEKVIFPALVRDPAVRRVVSVGCAWYTRRYEAVFHDREFWTIDSDERMKRHGATRHIVGPMTCLPQHLPAHSVDVVLCNGVFGFGLDAKDECEESVRAAFSCLRPGGLLIIGGCATGSHCAVPPRSLSSLASFQPHVLPPFTSPSYQTFSPLLHTFDFYRRPEEGP